MEHHVVLTPGQTYRNHNGYDYLCKSIYKELDTAVLERVSDGWELSAHGICLYEDGTIEWDYSTNGHWVSRPY